MRRKITLVSVLCLVLNSALAQHNVWVSYTNSKQLYGYKDLHGKIKIPAQFSGIAPADSFNHIIAVMDTTYHDYYLLKNGKITGLDSVFVFDFTFDCETEGKIRFKDKKNDKVGFFDENGKVIIPAIFNYASPFYNGIAIARKNSKKKCLDGECEHWEWIGGEVMLIDSNNDILIDNWNHENEDIDRFAMRINDPGVDSNLYVTEKGVNGSSYSFLSYDKEFISWFYTRFLPDLKSGDREKLLKLFFPEITYWSVTHNKWLPEPGNTYLSRNQVTLQAKLKDCNKKNTALFNEDLNKLIFSSHTYSRFYTACGEHFKERYPVFEAVKSYYKTDSTIDYQDDFDFIRTETGYRLFSVSITQ